MEPEEEVDMVLIEKAIAVAERNLSTARMNHRGAVLVMERLRDDQATDVALARQDRRVRSTGEFLRRHEAIVADLHRQRDELKRAFAGSAP